MELCNSAIYIGGLSVSLNSLLSCHKCVSSGSIPVIGVLSMLATTDSSLKNWSEIKLSPLPTSEAMQECMPLKNIGLIENCGLGVYEAASSSFYCVACNPNFRPIFQPDQHIIIECIPIPNCLSSAVNPHFDGCGECAEKKAYFYTYLDKLVTNVCVNTFTINCLAANLDGRCIFCKPGFFVNADSICEILTITSCMDKALQPYYDMTAGGPHLRYFFGEVGCRSCSPGYTSTFLTENRVICVESPYQLAMKLLPTTKLIRHCLNYEASIDPLCSKCDSGYLLTEDKQLCVLTLLNCMLASRHNSKSCFKCDPLFTSVNGICIQNDITNCSDYENTYMETASRCSGCEKKYVLKNSRECVRGLIKNCHQFDAKNSSKCVQCDPDFFRVTIIGYSDYCFPSPPSNLNCHKWSPEKFGSAVLECQECSSGHVLTTSMPADLPRDICLSLLPVENCRKYNTNSNDFSKASLDCLECEVAYYLDTLKNCATRKNFIKNCSKYEMTKDECVECKDDYMLNEDGSDCLPSPTGVYGCSEYAEGGECAFCGSGFYWNGASCSEVRVFIPNCELFLDESTCAVCQKGYLIENGLCVPSILEDCKSYNNASSCDTCFHGWGLMKAGDNWHCVPIHLDNCERWTKTYPFVCTRCTPWHFISSKGQCLQVRREITGCLYYSSESTCSQCQKHSALSVDGKYCVGMETIQTQIDNGCEASSISSEPECTRCELGYYLFNKRCIKCDVEENCLVCNPDFPGECLVCKSGFYQNASKHCGLYNPNGQSGEADELKGSAKAFINALLLLLLLL